MTTEFTASAVLDVSVSNNSLQSARDTIEQELGSATVDVESATASDRLTQAGSGMASPLTDGGGIASALLTLAEDRNDLLEEIEDRVGGRSAAGFLGGGAAGGIGGLAIQGAKVTASALIASAATVTAGALIAGGVTLVASDVINSPADINPDNLIAGGASITAGALIASQATITNSALIARAASIAPGTLVAAAATIPAAALIAGAATISAGVLIQDRADVTAGALIAGAATVTAGVLVGSAATVTAGALVATAATVRASDLIARRVFDVPEGPEDTAEVQHQTTANPPSTVTIDGQQVEIPGTIPENLTGGGEFGLTQERISEIVQTRQDTSRTQSPNRAQENQQTRTQVSVDVTNEVSLSGLDRDIRRAIEDVEQNVTQKIERALTGSRGGL